MNLTLKILFSFLLFSLLLVELGSPVFSEDLGNFGQVYDIAEEDFLTFIQNRLLKMQVSGEWQKIQDVFRQNVAQHADRPPVRFSLKTASQNRTRDYDPSITVPYDIRDTSGKQIVKAGTTVNPLKYFTLHHAFLFLDGDNPQQVKMAKHLRQTLNLKIKLVLVKGSVSFNEHVFKQPIYFDQGGKLITKFGIEVLPTLVWQKGLILKISEMKP